MKKIKAFFYYLFNFRKITLFNKVNAKLYAKIEDREVDRIILKGRIIEMTRKYLKIDAKSLYIPKDFKNNTEIREQIIGLYGDEMNKLGIEINSKLEFV